MDFKDLKELNRLVALVMRFYNSIVPIFETSLGGVRANPK
jgi:hypothetical protein